MSIATCPRRQGDIWAASPGCPGLETLLPIMLSEGFHKRQIPIRRLVELLCENPARIMGLGGRKGMISPGYDADFAVVNLDATTEVSNANVVSSAGYSIYDGWTLKGKVVHTLVRGEPVFENGALVEAAVGHGRYLHRQLPTCASQAGAMKQNGTVGSRFWRQGDQMKPWDGIISDEEQRAYRAAGFGKPTGFGRRPGLLIIDVQYRTVGTRPMPFWEAIKEFPTSCGEVGWKAVVHIERLLKLFRANGWPVLYPHVAPKEQFDAGRLADKVPALMGVAPKGYEFVAEVAPLPGDTLVPKKHPSAFFGTPLASYLIDKGIDSVIVTGCTTSGCVRGSVVDAFAYNFRVAVCQDAVYDRSHVSHCVNLFDMAEKYADVMTTDQCLQALGALGSAQKEPSRRRRWPPRPADC